MKSKEFIITKINLEDKETIKVPINQKPRQGPLRPQTGGGAHRDKKKEQKQGKEKHKGKTIESFHIDEQSMDQIIDRLHEDAYGIAPDHNFYVEWLSLSYQEKTDLYNSMIQSLNEASNQRDKRNPTRDFLRRYPVSDKDVAKPVKKPEKKKPQQGVAEAVPFSYGFVKRPRKGSVADLAAKKRKEQEKGKPPIEPKDQMVGVAKVTKGVAEGSNDTIYPNAQVIKSKNGKPIGEIYQDGNHWGCFHYRADRGYDFFDSREDAIEALKDLHSETGRSRPDYTIKGVAEGSLETDNMVSHIGQVIQGIYPRGGDKKTYMKLVAQEMPRIVKANPKLFRRAFGMAYDRFFHIDQDDDFDYTDYSMRKGERGVAERFRDPKDWDEGNTEPPNNFSVYINGKKWKVFQGRGRYAGDQAELRHYQQLRSWAAKKSAETGKKWEVSITGERATESIKEDTDIPFNQCPHCRGNIVHESLIIEKQDACYHKVKSRYKVWPSAYASGALVQCRKKGASNWGKKK